MSTGSNITIQCSASFQSIQNISLEIFQVSGIITQPTSYVNPANQQLDYYRIAETTSTITYTFSFANNSCLDLSIAPAASTNSLTTFTRSQYYIQINKAGLY